MSTVAKCLSEINVDKDALSLCATVEDEWSVIKKAYFKSILVAHPDKGGDPVVFRGLQSAFEVLRELLDSGAVTSFVSSGSRSTSEAYHGTFSGFEGMPTPSWEFYASAAEEPVPTYRVELARSGVSACIQKGTAKKCKDVIIEKGTIRVGSMNPESGSYGRWCHLDCWRVPSRIWLGLPDLEQERDHAAVNAALLAMNCVVLTGFSELSPEDRTVFAEYVIDKSNWAKLIKRRAKPDEPDEPAADGATAVANADAPEMPAGTIVAAGSKSGTERFVIPVPGHNGVPPGSLSGKTITLTGLFPEVGGGSGLNLGKERVKAIVQSFGGRVTSSVSGKTDFLIVGKAPGASKVSKARATGTKLITLHDLRKGLETGCLENMGDGQLVITNFSSGFYGNSIAANMSAAQLAIASGVVPPPKLLKKSPVKRKSPAAAKKSPAADNKSPVEKKKKKATSVSVKEEKATSAPQTAYVKEEEEEAMPATKPVGVKKEKKKTMPATKPVGVKKEEKAKAVAVKKEEKAKAVAAAYKSAEATRNCKVPVVIELSPAKLQRKRKATLAIEPPPKKAAVPRNAPKQRS